MNIEFYQNLTDALPYPAFILDEKFVIRCANEAAENLLERRITGLGFVQVLRNPDALACLNAAVDVGGLQMCDLVLHLHTQRNYQATAARLQASENTRGFFILYTLLDISAEIDAEKARSTFVANVSHELRSPLTSLMGVVETLKGPARNDEAARDKFLDLMQGETERMSRLVGDLLSLAKLEAKEHVAPDGEVDVPALAAHVSSVLSEGNQSYRGRLVITAAEVPIVRGNRDELTEVLQNLMENALKYSAPNTKVLVDIAVHESASKKWLRFTVVDRGDGIAPEHLPRLTERFYRVDNGRSREMGGTGLGLAISKHIINRHRGRLTFDSALGEGMTVTVSLPI